MADTQFGPNGWTPERLSAQSGNTYLITGANAGTGFQATRILLSKGASVVMLNRSVKNQKPLLRISKKNSAQTSKYDLSGWTSPI